MNFVNPWFFLGAAGVAVPLLLHLIKRERARKIEFPTLMFLRRVSKKTIRYQKLRHLLLLLLRVMAFLFLALAFTRPYRAYPTPSGLAGKKTATHVILLDNSLSMGYGDRWERARKAGAEIVRNLQDGDKAALLEFSDRTIVRIPATNDLAAVADDIQSRIQLTDRPTRYAQALKAAEKVALDSVTGRRVVHLISDYQKSGWAAEEQEFRLGAGIEVERVDVGSDDFSNITIGDVQVSEVGESSEGGLKIKFSIVNFGTQDRKDAGIILNLDGRTVMERRSDLSKGEVQGMEFLLPGLTAGSHQLSLAVEDPRLTRDNLYAMTLETRGRTQVMSIEDSAPSSGRSAGFFLSRALNVSALSRYQLVPVPFVRAESSGISTGALMIWNNAAGGSASLQKKVQEFVKNGGGLIIAAADNSRADDFNRSFGSWLPARIDGGSGTGDGRSARRGDGYALLTDIKLDHPIFRPFSEPHSGNFSSARFSRHARLLLAEGAETLARFDNGDPALVSIARDKGRVLIFASSADDSANNLPLKPVFAPFWQQMLHYLDNIGEGRRSSQVGETVAPRKALLEAALRLGKTGIDLNQAIVVLDPARQRVALNPGSDVFTLDKTGYYEIRAPNLSATVAANTVPRESDLAHGNAEEMTTGWLAPDAKTATALAEDEKLTPEDQDRGQRFWRFLLLAALTFFAGELLLSNQFVLKPDY